MPPMQAMLFLRKKRRVSSSTALRRRKSRWFMASVLHQHFIEVPTGIGPERPAASATLVQLLEHRHRLGACGPQRRQGEAARDLIIERAAGLAHALCETRGGFHKDRAVEQIERLERRVGTDTADDAELPVRRVK